MSTSSLKEGLIKLRKDILKPTSKMNLVEWADKFIYLSSENSSTPGKYSSSLVPASIEPQLAVTDPAVHSVTIMGPTQLLKTTVILNAIGFYATEDPSPILVVQPTGKLAESFAQDRLTPMIRDTPILAEIISDPKDRDSGSTKTHRVFPGGFVSVVSAGSPTDLASRPIKVLLMDEIDKYKTIGSEGDPTLLAAQRTDTFWNAKIIAVCSPTLEGSSRIAERFKASDQRYFQVPCPHCKTFQKLVWAQVRWDKNKPETARYTCAHCHLPWEETERLEACKQGTYIAERPFKGHAGFHVNALASPWTPPSELAEKFLDAKKDQEALKVFINTSLAETFKPAVEVPDWERIYDRRESWAIGTVPSEDVKFLTLGCDVQADRLEAQVVGWTKDKRSYVIDYKIIMGPTHTPEPWEALRNIIQNQTYPGPKGRDLAISFAAIDSGFNTSHVYNFVTQFSPNKVRAVKGSDTLRTFFRMGEDLHSRVDGSRRKIRLSHKLWMVGSSIIKESIYSFLRLPSKTETEDYKPGYIHIPELDEDYCKGLVSEGLEATSTGYKWVKLYGRNEPLDTFVYARAAASMFGLDRFSELEWAQLEGTDQPAKKKSKPSRPPAGSSLWKNPGLKKRS